MDVSVHPIHDCLIFSSALKDKIKEYLQVVEISFIRITMSKEKYSIKML